MSCLHHHRKSLNKALKNLPFEAHILTVGSLVSLAARCCDHVCQVEFIVMITDIKSSKK